jgi:hypothetical protein
VASAQVNAWLAVHRGSLDDVGPVVDETPGDAALARMMLHRRRAVVARAVGEFLDRLGPRFLPYLENRAPQAPRSFAGELELSKAAGTVAAALDGSAPPLLFERALLAEMDERNADALADLDELLKAYPGFLSAAIASARLAVIDEDPGRAIGSLAYVERELVHTREGSALLADALHAIGMHEAASHYDLATLICPDHAGSHGNDCAPVDMNGKAANHPRMPAAFIVAGLPDGRSVCNDRGIYYVGRPTAGGSVAELMANERPSRRDALRRSLRKTTVSTLAAGRRILRSAARSGVGGTLYLHYKRLPVPVRYMLNRYMRLPLRRRNKNNWQRIPEQDWRSDISRARLRSGITQILRRSAALWTIGSEHVDLVGAGHLKSTPVATEQTQSFETGNLSAAAASVLDDLVRRLRAPGSDAALSSSRER